jgi:hypothetical protein
MHLAYSGIIAVGALVCRRGEQGGGEVVSEAEAGSCLGSEPPNSRLKGSMGVLLTMPCVAGGTPVIIEVWLG